MQLIDIIKVIIYIVVKFVKFLRYIMHEDIKIYGTVQPHTIAVVFLLSCVFTFDLTCLTASVYIFYASLP